MLLNYEKAGSALLEMSQRTGMSTTALSELKYAAQLCGTDLDTVELAAKKMASSLVDASMGSDAAKAAFTALGLNVQELMTLTPDQQFDRIAKAVAGIEDPTKRAALAQDVFGRSGTKLLPIFAGGAAGLDAMKQKAHDLGVVMDAEACTKADALGDSITTLKGSLSGIGNTVATTLAPIITNLATTISNVIMKVKGWMEAHPGLTSALVKIAAVVGILATVLGPIIIMLPLLASGFSILLGPVGLVAAAIAGLIAIGTLVVTHWTEIKTFFVTVWETIASFFVAIFERIKLIFSTAWEAIKTGISAVFETIKTIVQTGWEAIVGVFNAFKTAVWEVVQALIQGIIDKFTWLFRKIGEIVGKIKDVTVGAFKSIWKKVTGGSIVPDMVASVVSNFMTMKTGIGQIMGEVETGTKTIFGNISDYAQAMESSSSGSFKSMGDSLKDAGRSILATLEKQAIGYIITKVMAQFPFPVNLALAAVGIAAVKALFGAIKLAEGGIVKRPTLAMIGERGPEAVIPLDRPGALAFAGAGGGVTLRQNNYFYGDLNNMNDIDEISRRLAERTIRAISKGRR